ncbi:MAG: GMC family oxidoreductase [Pseudomonadota bacterium]
MVLDAELTDSDGIPARKPLYRNSKNTQKLIAWHLERAQEAMEAAGASETAQTELMRDCGWHMTGTARMGRDPARSVVDEWGAAHDVPNLHIMDGSVFITSSGRNPTATIIAVALRRRAQIVEQRRDLETAA